MAYLSTVELAARGDTKAVIANDEHGDYLAFVWMDRERRYFIATAGSMEAGSPYQRTRWRQVNQEQNAPPELVDLEIHSQKQQRFTMLPLVALTNTIIAITMTCQSSRSSEHGTGQSGSTFRFLGCVWWIPGLFIKDALVH